MKRYIITRPGGRAPIKVMPDGLRSLSGSRSEVTLEFGCLDKTFAVAEELAQLGTSCEVAELVSIRTYTVKREVRVEITDA